MSDLTTLKLEWLCASKDAAIGQLTMDLAEARATLIVEQARAVLGASPDAQWDAPTFSFVEPPAAPDEPCDPTPTEVVV